MADNTNANPNIDWVAIGKKVGLNETQQKAIARAKLTTANDVQTRGRAVLGAKFTPVASAIGLTLAQPQPKPKAAAKS